MMNNITEYIPKNLDAAIRLIINNLSNKEIQTIKICDTITLHMDAGRYLRNNWGLWSNSELAQWFKSTLGIWHPDDMSAIILDSVQRTLNNEDIKLNEQVKYYLDYWNSNYNEDMHNITYNNHNIHIIKFKHVQ